MSGTTDDASGRRSVGCNRVAYSERSVAQGASRTELFSSFFERVWTVNRHHQTEVPSRALICNPFHPYDKVGNAFR